MTEVVFGSDHGGFDLKKLLITYLKKSQPSVKIKDFGTFDGQKSVDYPDYAHKVAQEVLTKKTTLGVVICGTGIGISIAINRHKGIRGALVKTKKDAIMTRKHNDSNVLALGGRTTSFEKAKKILDAFLNTKFEGGRHLLRISKIEKY